MNRSLNVPTKINRYENVGSTQNFDVSLSFVAQQFFCWLCPNTLMKRIILI